MVSPFSLAGPPFRSRARRFLPGQHFVAGVGPSADLSDVPGSSSALLGGLPSGVQFGSGVPVADPYAAARGGGGTNSVVLDPGSTFQPSADQLAHMQALGVPSWQALVDYYSKPDRGRAAAQARWDSGFGAQNPWAQNLLAELLKVLPY